jgi:hypothetical protein
MLFIYFLRQTSCVANHVASLGKNPDAEVGKNPNPDSLTVHETSGPLFVINETFEYIVLYFTSYDSIIRNNGS